jgi:hypothetical protein
MMFYFARVTWGSKNKRKGAASQSSLSYCKVTLWLLTFHFIHFVVTFWAFWSVFTFVSSGTVITAHGSLGFKQEIQLQLQRIAIPNPSYTNYCTFTILIMMILLQWW